jgi:hypothetical protein
MIRRLALLAGIIALILCCAFVLSGCTAQRAEPEARQMVSQGSPSIIVNPACKENCGGATITTGGVEAEAGQEARQETPQTTTGGGLGFLGSLGLLAIISAIGFAAYKLYKWRRL